MRARRGWSAAMAMLAGCAGGGTAGADLPAPGMCMPMEGSLGAGATLAGNAGRYTLTLVSSDGSRSTDGTLVLRERAADRRTMGPAATPLDGTAEIDLAAVGAQAVTGLGSTDPSAPGVLVLEGEGRVGPAVTVRFGSVSNRETDPAIDAAFTVLDVTAIEDGGFFGGWRSGVRLERSNGYFCAWPEGD